MLKTDRLKLVPHSVDLLRAEIGNHVQLARLLGAVVPKNWPPKSTVDALPFFLNCVESSPLYIGWMGWYAVTTTTGSFPELIGSGGFMGPPENGAAQLGYSIIDQHQNQGFATEMVGGLIKWAFSNPECTRLVAETEWENPFSVRVLKNNGFSPVGAASEPGGLRFELSALQADG